jgi:hypothetical protein
MVRSSTALIAPTAYPGTATGEDAATEEARRRRRQARAREETRRILVDFREAQRDRCRPEFRRRRPERRALKGG